MAALTHDRDTVSRSGTRFAFPVAAGAKIHGGAIVVLDGGVAKGAITATGLVGAGCACKSVDNTAGAAGAVTVEVSRGTFCWSNAGDVTLAHVGGPAYAVDDQTISASSATNTRSPVGTIRDVDARGVWVEI